MTKATNAPWASGVCALFRMLSRGRPRCCFKASTGNELWGRTKRFGLVAALRFSRLHQHQIDLLDGRLSILV